MGALRRRGLLEDRAESEQELVLGDPLQSAPADQVPFGDRQVLGDQRKDQPLLVVEVFEQRGAVLVQGERQFLTGDVVGRSFPYGDPVGDGHKALVDPLVLLLHAGYEPVVRGALTQQRPDELVLERVVAVQTFEVVAQVSGDLRRAWCPAVGHGAHQPRKKRRLAAEDPVDHDHLVGAGARCCGKFVSGAVGGHACWLQRSVVGNRLPGSDSFLASAWSVTWGR